jgi:hypothetical protein
MFKRTGSLSLIRMGNARLLLSQFCQLDLPVLDSF